MEKKRRRRTRKEISEQARVNAENSPIVRELRELYARGKAELAERERRRTASE
jgi:hypothetical protein